MPDAQFVNASEKGNPVSARDLIALYYGSQIRLQPFETTLTVGTSSVQAGKLSNQRVAVTFSNPGANLIVVGLSAGVTATSGYVVPANGFLSFTWLLDGELVMRDFWAISGTASQTLYVAESVLSVVN
jgi:hypothetical protein